VTTLNLRILGIVTLVCILCYANAARLRKLGDLGLVMDVIEQQYVDPADPQALYSAAMSGMLASLDPYSSYIPPESLQPFQAILEQEFGGLGVSLDGPPRRDRLTIVSTLYDSPAYRAGVKPGDIILEVDGFPVADLQFTEASKRLRGKEGTTAQLKLERPGESDPLLISVTRARIEVESVLGDRRLENGRWEFRMQADEDIGYFHIELFGEKSADELKRAIESKSTPWKALIIDVRDNTGGLLFAATDICDFFLEGGEIVSTKGRNGTIDEVYDATPGALVPPTVPVVVLVNEQSASASEILAACLQDRDRAIIVGTRTFGKGSVQNVIPLEGGKAAMRLTTAYYYPPKGRLIHRRKDAKQEEAWGVMPNDGYTVDVAEPELAAIGERFRRRADPRFIPEPAGTGETNPWILRDPTLMNDPQLLRALEAIEAFAEKELVDK
jgi:carboxyl-terminal processing protease